MVFGESVLNDAVAIVLSRTLLGFNKPGTVIDSESITAAVISFCTIFFGSLLIGAIYGIVSALVFKQM
jgi:NhaP-type Na+/H+ or K+/H+ antiporter